MRQRNQVPGDESTDRAGRRKLCTFRCLKGLGDPNVDALACRSHLRALTLVGAGLDEVASRIGVSHRTLARVLTGQPMVRRSTAAAILSVFPAQLRHGVGARRRVEALAVAGWPLKAQMRAAGVTSPPMWSLLAGECRHDPGFIAAIYEMFSRLWRMNPRDAGIPQWRVCQTQSMALARGFLPALAWDEIDDPDEKPTQCVYVPPSAGERVEDARFLLDEGLSPEAVIERTGWNEVESMLTAASRNGQRDLRQVVAIAKNRQKVLA